MSGGRRRTHPWWIVDDLNIADLLDMYLRDAGFRCGGGRRAARFELIEQHRPSYQS
jgi:hypothetical protein